MSAITVVLAFACTFTTCALVAAICTGADLEKRLEDERIESAGLRRLVRKVVQFERAGCERCPHWDSCDADTLYDPCCPMRKDIERDMRELGVDE